MTALGDILAAAGFARDEPLERVVYVGGAFVLHVNRSGDLGATWRASIKPG